MRLLCVAVVAAAFLVAASVIRAEAGDEQPKVVSTRSFAHGIPECTSSNGSAVLFGSGACYVTLLDFDMVKLGEISVSSGTACDLKSAAYDGRIAAVASFGMPGTIYFLDTYALTVLASVSAPAGFGQIRSATTVTGFPNAMAIFGTEQSPARLLYVDMVTRSVVDTRILSSGQDALVSAAYLPGPKTALFVAATKPGRVIKVILGANAISTVTAVELPTGANTPRVIIVPRGQSDWGFIGIGCISTDSACQSGVVRVRIDDGFTPPTENDILRVSGVYGLNAAVSSTDGEVIFAQGPYAGKRTDKVYLLKVATRDVFRVVSVTHHDGLSYATAGASHEDGRGLIGFWETFNVASLTFKGGGAVTARAAATGAAVATVVAFVVFVAALVAF